jgi:hypothetical protein
VVTILVSEKTAVLTFLALGPISVSLGAFLPSAVHNIECCVVFCISLWSYVLNIVIKCHQKSELCYVSFRHSLKVSSQFSFCSRVRNRGSHLSERFCMQILSGNMQLKHFFETLIASAIPRTFGFGLCEQFFGLFGWNV